MRDGSAYTGEFNQGEITGQGVRSLGNGQVYSGSFLEGELHGMGLVKYGENNKTEKSYVG